MFSNKDLIPIFIKKIESYMNIIDVIYKKQKIFNKPMTYQVLYLVLCIMNSDIDKFGQLFAS